MKKILYLESVMFNFLSLLFKGDCGSLLSYRHYYVCHVIRWICQLYSAEPYVKLSGAIHTSQSISPPPTPCDPDVCHHQCGKIPFGWARSPPLSASVSPSLSLFLFLSLFYGGRDENGCLIMQRGQPIKGPGPGDLKAYSEHSWRERERGVRGRTRELQRERWAGVWLLYATGQLSSTYLWSHFTNNCPW